jgi:branched-chain amino acid transport system permease protein
MAERRTGALRDAGLSALVAVGIFGVMVGLHTSESDSGLYLEFRPIAAGVLVALVFFGRLLALAIRDRDRGEAYREKRRFAEALTRTGKYVAPILLAVAVLLPFILQGLNWLSDSLLDWSGVALPIPSVRFGLDLGVLVMTYVMLGWGLNIVVGLAGLLDLGYVAFYAVGAYSYSIISTTFGLGFWTCLPLAGILAALWGILLGFPVLRLRGDYLAIVTLAFGEIIRIVINNWVSLTNGPNGISGIPRPTLFGLKFTGGDDPGTFAGFFGLDPSPTYRVVFLFYVILGLALLTNWVTLRLRRLPLGRAWEALREDEIACRSLGINITVTKLTAFAIGAMFGGFAGAFFATRQAFISPESFTFIESATVLAIVVLGGMGSQLGTALAAVVMIGGLEMLRYGLATLANASQNETFQAVANELPLFRMLIFGVALVTMMVLRPRGLVSGRTPTVALGESREIAAELVAQGRG